MNTIVCVDVGYDDQNNTARAACVTLSDWGDRNPAREFVLDLDEIEPYVPGEFYRRELPCVLAVLDHLHATPDVVVVDGYVWLDALGKKGLGAHLFDALDERIPVIGVAKTSFATATEAIEVCRGKSDRPLFITAAGLDATDAADLVRNMHGKHRLPTALKRVDQLSRT